MGYCIDWAFVVRLAKFSVWCFGGCDKWGEDGSLWAFKILIGVWAL